MTYSNRILRVGLCGPKGVGKSSSAEWASSCCEDLGDRIISFDVIHNLHSSYEALAIMWGVPRSLLENAITKDTPWIKEDAPVPALVGETPRDLLDQHGIEMREKFGDDIFVKLWHRSVDRLQPRLDEFMVVFNTSVRFDCEAEGMDMVIEITRPGVEYDGTQYNTRISDHLITHHVAFSKGELVFEDVKRLREMTVKKCMEKCHGHA